MTMNEPTMTKAEPGAGKREVFSYEVKFKGVWGRNRSVKFEVAHLRDADAKLDDAGRVEIVAAAKAHLVKIKAKPGTRYVVEETPTTIETYDYGDGRIGRSRSFMVFSGTKIAEGVVA
jgi:hypothetical protein